MSGLGANYERDLRKIIALSTLRQLGLMIMSLGLGFYELAFFHLLTHAMFKSLLFLCAGVFIHSIGDTQDIRILGGLMISCPVTSFYFIGASMALCGFPFLSGFYSRDIILECFFIRKINLFIVVMVVLATVITLTYRVRLIFYLFFNNFGRRFMVSIEEESVIILPMGVLFLLSVSAGGGLRLISFPIVFIFLPLVFKLLVLLFLGVIFIVMFNLFNIDIYGGFNMSLKKFFMGAI